MGSLWLCNWPLPHRTGTFSVGGPASVHSTQWWGGHACCAHRPGQDAFPLWRWLQCGAWFFHHCEHQKGKVSKKKEGKTATNWQGQRFCELLKWPHFKLFLLYFTGWGHTFGSITIRSSAQMGNKVTGMTSNVVDPLLTGHTCSGVLKTKII